GGEIRSKIDQTLRSANPSSIADLVVRSIGPRRDGSWGIRPDRSIGRRDRQCRYGWRRRTWARLVLRSRRDARDRRVGRLGRRLRGLAHALDRVAEQALGTGQRLGDALVDALGDAAGKAEHTRDALLGEVDAVVDELTDLAA